MSTPLYFGRFEKKKGNTVDYRLTMTHPDESRFGTDRVFGWKLLSDWVSPNTDGTELEQARRYVKRVTLSPLENAKVDRKGPNWFSVKRVGRKNPSLVYSIEVADPALLDGIKVGDKEDVYQYVEDAPALGNDDSPAGARRFEFSEGTSNKFWEVSVEGKALHVRYGKIGAVGTRQKKTFGSPALTQKEADKLVAEKLKKGYREITASAPAAQAAVKGAAPVAKAGALAPKTFEDFRDEALGLAARCSSAWQDYTSAFLQQWAKTSSDAQLTGWLQQLYSADEAGWLTHTAALVAIERARAGNRESATGFLELAEKALPKDAWASRKALQGLIPAWWRLGETKKADAAFKPLREATEKKTESHLETKQLLLMAARGGNTALVVELAPRLDASWSDELGAATVELYRDGDAKGFTAVRTRWPDSDSFRPSGMIVGLFEEAMTRGKPEEFLELILTSGKALNEYGVAATVLDAVERKDARLAVSFATRVLQSDQLYGVVKPMAVAILATHAPAEAKKWAQAHLDEHEGVDRVTFLAALQRHDEARAGLAAAIKSGKVGELGDLARVTMNSALARDALQALVTHSGYEPSYSTEELVRLVDLGEQALVDSVLEKRLASIEKRKPRDRDLDCRRLGAAAASVWRADLALKAWSLPTPSVRYCTAGDSVSGAAKVGDWSAACALLMKVPDDGANGRVSTALHAGLRAAREAVLQGPRAPVMRCIAFGGS